MINLAGCKDADRSVEREFHICGIELVPIPPEITNQRYREVPTRWEGRLGSFVFRRAWYYVVVLGKVPIETARELYADPCGKTDVRVAGHCGCPPPEKPWTEWTRGDEVAISTKDMADLKKYDLALDGYVASDDPTRDGFREVVTSYHIDSEVGLRVFVDTLKKNGVVP